MGARMSSEMTPACFLVYLFCIVVVFPVCGLCLRDFAGRVQLVDEGVWFGGVVGHIFFPTGDFLLDKLQRLQSFVGLCPQTAHFTTAGILRSLISPLLSGRGS